MLHRHTIPLFIPLDGYAEEYLGRGVLGLEELALKVHRQLILLSNRTATVARLKLLKGVEQVNVDEAVQLVELVTAKWTAKIILQDEGERGIVVDKSNQRLQDVEKAMLNEPEKDLVERISQAI
jgi:Cenp-O kinetochore centromere component